MDAKLPGSDMRYFAQNVVSRTCQVCLPASFAESPIFLNLGASGRQTIPRDQPPRRAAQDAGQNRYWGFFSILLK